jgi:hypothetical protein
MGWEPRRAPARVRARLTARRTVAPTARLTLCPAGRRIGDECIGNRERHRTTLRRER